MASETTRINKGMKVFASDGEELGTVTHVWLKVGETPAEPQNYLVAGEGGFLGIGEKDLYVPFEAIESVGPGESVRLKCDRDQCHELYAEKPEVIRKKEVMKAEAAVIAATTPVIFRH